MGFGVADGVQILRLIKAAVFPLTQLFGGHLMHPFIETFHSHRAGFIVVETVHNPRHFAQRVQAGTPVMARVQVDARAGQGKLILQHTAQLRGN